MNPNLCAIISPTGDVCGLETCRRKIWDLTDGLQRDHRHVAPLNPAPFSIAQQHPDPLPAGFHEAHLRAFVEAQADHAFFARAGVNIGFGAGDDHVVLGHQGVAG